MLKIKKSDKSIWRQKAVATNRKPKMSVGIAEDSGIL